MSLDLPEEDIPTTVPNGTLELITSRTYLKCGVVVVSNNLDHSHPNGFAYYNSTSGEWTGLHVEICKGLAAALFNQDVNAVEFVPFDKTHDAFVGLANHVIDVYAGAPFTIENDVKEPTTGRGFEFSPIYYYGDNYALGLTTNENVNAGDDIQWSRFVRWMVYA